MAVTTVKGISNHVDTLIGGADGSDFIFNSDGIWNPGSFTRAVGDPGHPGPFITFDTAGKQASTDFFIGQPGVHNTLKLGNAAVSIFLDTNTGLRLVNIDKIVGGSGDQDINLSSLQHSYGDVTISTGGGNDVVAANAGNDTINLGTGDDFAWGGSGNDSILGSTGSDRVMGGDGNDRLYGGAGGDIVEGGAGNDVVSGGAGSDLLVGGSGNDTLNGGIESGPVTDGLTDDAYGEEGDDLIVGGGRSLFAYGGEGNDTFRGGVANDTLIGGNGDDVYNGGRGADTYDATQGVGNNLFRVMVDGPSVDSILGFHDAEGDRIQAKFSDIGLAPAPLTSVSAGATALIGGGIATVTYATSANASGTFDIVSIAVASDAVVTVASGVIAATASHAQFLFDRGNGDLWFDGDGTGTAAAVKIAHLDLATATASVTGLSGVALEASDFIFANA
jgi:Ca2+-binding RTX toxin-like protein